jgi:hypothetical protein
MGPGAVFVGTMFSIPTLYRVPVLPPMPLRRTGCIPCSLQSRIFVRYSGWANDTDAPVSTFKITLLVFSALPPAVVDKVMRASVIAEGYFTPYSVLFSSCCFVVGPLACKILASLRSTSVSIIALICNRQGCGPGFQEDSGGGSSSSALDSSDSGSVS